MMIVNDKFEKEAEVEVVCFKILLRLVPGGTKDNCKSQDSFLQAVNKTLDFLDKKQKC
jgi:hypothetical protein